MSDERRYYTIPQLARRLGITPASIRAWIACGLIEEPQALPVTGERAYTAGAAARIERWHMERCLRGGTRGPGAAKRRERARVFLATLGEEVRNDR